MVKDCPSPSDGRTNSTANVTYLASATLCESPRSERIIIDSGTTSHMTNNKDWLTNCKVLNPPKIVVLGAGHKVFAHGIGTLAVTLHLDDNMKYTADMRNCLFVPDLSCSLFSVRSATADGTKTVSFGRNVVRITDSTNRVITTGSLIDDVYILSTALCVYPVKVNNVVEFCHTIVQKENRTQLRRQTLVWLLASQLTCGIVVLVTRASRT